MKKCTPTGNNDPTACMTADGWLAGVERCPTPNCNERPKAMEVELLVIHNISLPPKIFGGSYIESFFCNLLDPSEHPYFAEIADLQVSAHCLIKRGGQVLQFVPFTLRAWHAGVSEFQGRSNCNDFSIGIELEGADDVPFEMSQYRSLAAVIGRIRRAYPHISLDNIVGHSDIAPTRKTDPGPAFDWAYLRQLLITPK